MAKNQAKERAPRERSPFVEDAILRETVRKERMNAVDFTEFHPSMVSLRDATPDKPLVSSFCSRCNEITVTDEDLEMTKTLHLDTIDKAPYEKYSYPMTTSQEIGWDAINYKPRTIFDHRHKKTDITMLPSKWDPKANVMAAQLKEGGK